MSGRFGRSSRSRGGFATLRCSIWRSTASFVAAMSSRSRLRMSPRADTRRIEQTRQAVDDYLMAANKKPGEFLFAGHRGSEHGMTTRQYARLVFEWIGSVGLDPKRFGTHSLRRTKATLIYRRIGNLTAGQLLLGHTKIERTVRYLGIEVDDALAIAEQVDV